MFPLVVMHREGEGGLLAGGGGGLLAPPPPPPTHETCNVTKSTTLSWVFFTSFKLYNGTKSLKVSHSYVVDIKILSDFSSNWLKSGSHLPKKNGFISFLFHLKSSSGSQDISIFVLTFWSCRENTLIRRLMKNSIPQSQVIWVHVIAVIYVSRSRHCIIYTCYVSINLWFIRIQVNQHMPFKRITLSFVYFW